MLLFKLKMNLNASRPSEHPPVRGEIVKTFRDHRLQRQFFFVAFVVGPHIQRIVLATEEITVTQQVSHRPIKCQSRSWSQRSTKVNGSHPGDIPVLEPAGIQIATEPMPGPTIRDHRKLIVVKTMYLGTSYSFYCHSLECCQYLGTEIQYNTSSCFVY